MEQEKQDMFAELLFEKYEESLKALQGARRERALGELEVQNLEETIRLLQWRIAHQAAHEQRQLSVKPDEAMAGRVK